MILPWLLSGGWRYAIMGLLALAWGVQTLRLDSVTAGIAEAAKVATDMARKKDAENAQLASTIDQANLEKRDAIDKATDNARALARSRGLYVHTRCNLPSTPATPGSGQSGTAQGRISDADADAILSIARDADKAALYAQSCHDWAISIGKR